MKAVRIYRKMKAGKMDHNEGRFLMWVLEPDAQHGRSAGIGKHRAPVGAGNHYDQLGADPMLTHASAPTDEHCQGKRR
jgi:hypothetical protein